MEGVSIIQIAIIIAVTLIGLSLTYWIVGNILAKAGFSRWWFLILLVPLVNIIAIWIFAFKKWPNIDNSDRASVPADME